MKGVLEWYPVLGLVAILGGFWAWASIQHRRLLKAATEAAARLNGTYKPGGHLSGGLLNVKSGGRDIVFEFNLSHSARSASTCVMGILSLPTAKEIVLKGPDVLALAPRLSRYSRWFAPVKIRIKFNLLTVEIFGIVRSSERLVELASIVSDLAADLDKRSG